MELMTSGSLNLCRPVPVVRALPSISDDGSPSSSLISRKPSRFFSLKFKGSQLPTKRLQSSSLMVTAVAGDRTAVPNNFTVEEVSEIGQSHSRSNHEVPESNQEQDVEDLDDLIMARVYDKLIDIFMVDKPTPTDWRKLIVFSKGWSDVRPHFFRRCQERADNDNSPEMKHKLLRLARKLREIDADLQRHNELLQLIRSAPSQIGEVVARRRKDFTQEFFMHLHMVADSYHDNPTEQNDILKLGNTCLATVQTYDNASASIAALDAAELKFQDIISSPTLDAACRKIDDLADKKQLDPALVLMINKAWATVKGTDITKNEAKDILYHLYMKARANMEKELPKETRILKHLLTIEDPEERISALNDAFTPGVVLEEDVDLLYTEPERLLNYIKRVMDAYNFSRDGTLLKEARDLMDPMVIQRLEELHSLILDKFM